MHVHYNHYYSSNPIGITSWQAHASGYQSISHRFMDEISVVLAADSASTPRYQIDQLFHYGLYRPRLIHSAPIRSTHLRTKIGGDRGPRPPIARPVSQQLSSLPDKKLIWMNVNSSISTLPLPLRSACGEAVAQVVLPVP